MAKSVFAKTAEASIRERTLVDVRRFQAAKEKVFDAWTDGTQIAKWMGPEGFTIPAADLDAREGGNYRITMRSPAGNTVPTSRSTPLSVSAPSVIPRR